MKIVQLYTPQDFDRLDKVLMYDVWYRQALTDKQVAKLFGVTASDVKEKRSELGVRWMNSAIASISGGSTFTSRETLVVTRAPKEWDGKPITFRPGKHRSIEKSDLTELLDDKTDKIEETTKVESSKPAVEDCEDYREDAARAWQELKQQEIDERDSQVNLDAQLDSDGQLVINGVEYDISKKSDNRDEENTENDKNDKNEKNEQSE